MNEKQMTLNLKTQPDGSPTKDPKGNKALDTTLGFLKKPDNLTFVTTVTLSMVFAIWGIVGDAPMSKLFSALMALLALFVTLLWMSHQTASHISQTICQLRDEISDPAIGKVLHRFDEFDGEIRVSLKTADEIWLLSRTGQGWWKNYEDEIGRALNGNGNSRFLFLHPDSEAFKLAAVSAKEEWQSKDVWHFHRENANGFYAMLCANHATKLELKVTEYFPAWTLLIINPSKKDKDTVIFVELATFKAGSRDRPVFKVKPQDALAFNRFIGEFEQMWKRAAAWPASGE
jgi:hypothetical protein